MSDVATAAGVGRATLYRRYDSRDALVQAAVARDARRFFSAIALAVVPAADRPPQLSDLVVEGILAGLSLARRSPLGDLLRRDPATAAEILGSAEVMAAATRALTDLYQDLRGEPLAPLPRLRIEGRAEALVRLALSFLLFPGDLDRIDHDRARRRLETMISPLTESGTDSGQRNG